MPYDRATELLWNYIGIAQFSDFSRLWGQGPSSFTPADDSETDVSKGLSVHSMIGPMYTSPLNWTLPVADNNPLISSSIGFTSSPVTFLPPANPPNLPFSVQDEAAHFSSTASSSGGHIRISYEWKSLNFNENPVIATTTTSHEQTSAASGETPIPKIYGPADVHMTAFIDSGDNIQTNTVITSGFSDARGWSHVGATLIGNIISQIDTPETQNELHISVDYIHGDHISRSMITQLNTVNDIDSNYNKMAVSASLNSLLPDTNISQGISSGGNDSQNNALLVGNQEANGYDVLVVTGNLSKLNKIIQVNLLVDNDSNTVLSQGDISTPHGTADSIWDAAVQSGGNIEVNIGFIVDQSSGITYLVGGYYGSSHSVTQLNILNEADLNRIIQLFHSQEGLGFLSSDTSGLISSGSNSQSNTAGFTDSGDSGSADTSHTTPSDLTSLLDYAGLHAGDADIHVLYVDGNYTIINMVVQINVIYDSDHNTQIIKTSGAMGSLTPPDNTSNTTTDSTTDASASNESSTATETAPGTGTTTETTTETEAGTGIVSTAGTDASSSGTNNADSEIPTYTDHGSLNYDQVISSGSNSSTNNATIIDGTNETQLQIVLGNYTEHNEIYQINLIYDIDNNTIIDTKNVNINYHDNNLNDNSTQTTSATDILNKMTS